MNTPSLTGKGKSSSLLPGELSEKVNHEAAAISGVSGKSNINDDKINDDKYLIYDSFWRLLSNYFTGISEIQAFTLLPSSIEPL
jgi:hypothetical protein